MLSDPRCVIRTIPLRQRGERDSTESRQRRPRITTARGLKGEAVKSTVRLAESCVLPTKMLRHTHPPIEAGIASRPCSPKRELKPRENAIGAGRAPTLPTVQRRRNDPKVLRP